MGFGYEFLVLMFFEIGNLFVMSGEFLVFWFIEILVCFNDIIIYYINIYYFIVVGRKFFNWIKFIKYEYKEEFIVWVRILYGNFDRRFVLVIFVVVIVRWRLDMYV